MVVFIKLCYNGKILVVRWFEDELFYKIKEISKLFIILYFGFFNMVIKMVIMFFIIFILLMF